LPGLRLQAHALERGAGDAPHPAVDVREAAAVDDVEDPGRDRRAEVAVERRHRAGLDRPLPARPHHELVALAKARYEGGQLAEVVRAVGVFFFQAEDGIRDYKVTGVQTCALP